MTESDEDKINRLRSMTAKKQRKWDLSANDVNAITFALAEIERLTEKTNRLIDTIGAVADTKLIGNHELYQYLHAGDTAKEVIE